MNGWQIFIAILDAFAIGFSVAMIIRTRDRK